MVLLLLCLLVVAGALVGAAAVLWVTSPPVSPDQRHFDGLARQDRRR